MFRKLRRFARLHRERLLSLVMLPAFILGTLPQTVCICADGRRAPFCPMANSNAERPKSTCCDCSCCAKGPSAEQRECCRGHQHDGATLPGWSGPQHPGCHLLVETPDPAVKAGSTPQSDGEPLVAALPPDGALTAPMARDDQPLGWQSSLPPPRDLPVVYLHLTI